MSATTLLPLRDDLRLHPGPSTPEGEPTWTVEDPARHRFFELDWISVELLQRWSFGDAALVAARVAQETSLRPAPEDVLALQAFLLDNELLQPRDAAGRALLLRRDDARRSRSAWSRLLHGYLFFRVPLLRPDAWLARHGRLLAPLSASGFGPATLLALLAGLWGLSRQWDDFHATLMQSFDARGLLAWGVALVFAKLVHELGHAATAKRLGCRVPVMGVAFMVLCPFPYTDTTDTWKLADPAQRFRVAFAGIRAELMLATWATLAWTLLPPGAARDIAFTLATTTWVSTLLVNLSPFMRFDGYFLLSDRLNMPNLHERSGALARWMLRRMLFGTRADAPEDLPAGRRRALAGFAVVTWLYRLTVFVGIALLVYHFFVKAVGIALFALEIWWFVLRPLWSELRAWPKAWWNAPWARRLLVPAALAGLLWWLPTASVPQRLVTTGLLEPAEVVHLHAGAAGQLQAVLRRPGEAVTAGAAVVALANPEQDRRDALLRERDAAQSAQLATAVFDPAQQAKLQSMQAERAKVRAERQAVRAETRVSAPPSPVDGTVRDMDPELRPGVWVARNERLATIVGAPDAQVHVYVDELDVASIRPGTKARFSLKADPLSSIELEVTGVEEEAARALPSRLFAAQAGGSVRAAERDGQLVPTGSVYRVRLKPLSVPAAWQAQQWRGTVSFDLGSKPPAWRWVRWAAAVLVREAGF